MSSMRPVPAAVAAVLLLAALAAAPAGAQVQSAHPIPTTGPAPSTPAFVGHAATPRPLAGVRPARTNPFMARDPHEQRPQLPVAVGHLHAVSAGPLGRPPQGLLHRVRPRLHHADLRPPGPARRVLHLPRRTGPRLLPLTPPRSTRSPFIQLPYVPPPPGQPGTEHHGRRVLLPRQPRPGRHRHHRPPHLRWSARPRGHGMPASRRVRDVRPDPVPAARRADAVGAAGLHAAACGSSAGTHGTRRRRSTRQTGTVRARPPQRGDRELVRRRPRDGVYIVTDNAHVQASAPAAHGCARRRSGGRPYRNVGIHEDRGSSTPARANAHAQRGSESGG